MTGPVQRWLETRVRNGAGFEAVRLDSRDGLSVWEHPASIQPISRAAINIIQIPN